MSLQNATGSNGVSNNASEKQITVIVVDDSAVIRGMITRILQESPSIKVVDTVANGIQAVDSAAKHKPDILLLDVEMPLMDGMTALPKILESSPKTKIIMCSTLTVRNGETTLEALRLGATDCIAKPTSVNDLNTGTDFKTTLLNMVIGIGNPSAASSQAATTGVLEAQKKPGEPLQLRAPNLSFSGKPSVIAIGSSTGGPQALFEVLAHFKDFDVPIILTQHMPATFTSILAQHITRQTGLEAVEGANGMKLEKGKVYVAPGGMHMGFKKSGVDVFIEVRDDPPENFCKPAVDVMIRSAQSIFGEKILAVILTGMGNDGLKSCKDLVEVGGKLIAQDENTSVVWGMPGAVANAGLCTSVLPLNQIGPWVKNAVQ